jgi:hypothetical protein
MAVGKATAQATLFLEKLAPKSIRFDEAPLQTRAGRGKAVQELKPGDRIVRLVVAWESGEMKSEPTSARTSRGRAKKASGQPQQASLPGKKSLPQEEQTDASTIGTTPTRRTRRTTTDAETPPQSSTPASQARRTRKKPSPPAQG